MKRYLLSGLCLILLLAGCQRLSIDKTKELDGGETICYPVDPPSYEQALKVEIKSDPEPVSAAIVKAANEDDALNALNGGKKHQADILVQKEKEKEFTLEKTIPAKTPYVVVVTNLGHKKTKINVKIIGR